MASLQLWSPLFLFSLLLCCCFSLISSTFLGVEPSANPRTLVLVDNPAIEDQFSRFFQTLENRGHELTFNHVYDDDVRLEKYGEYFYDNLILFAPSAEDLGESISINSILEFIDSGRNVLIGVNANVSEQIRNLAGEIGISIDEEHTQVIDHFRYDDADSQNEGLHTLIASSNVVQNKVILGPKAISSPVLFSGIGHSAAEGTHLLHPLLTGHESTFSANPHRAVSDYPQSAGKKTLLVSAIQTRNNARIVFSGSLQLFSNEFFAKSVRVHGEKNSVPKSGNEEFAINLAKWNFHEKGVLRGTKLTHKLVDSDALNPKAYRVMDNIEFSVILEEWDGVENKWTPFNEDDVQLELVMLDPYVRINLSDDNKGRYFTTFQVPDVYGVYKFLVHYHRIGYSNLELSQTIPIHPFRHNQFERFIPCAYPYYLAAFSVMAAFFLFSILFLYQKDN